jgi:DoxX-like family
MLTAYVVVGALLAAYLIFSVTADFARIRPVMTAMAKADVPPSWLPTLATIKAVGALGLLVGIGVPLIGPTAGVQTAGAVIGAAAAVGVILFFAGAILVHLRARDISFGAFAPATVFLLLAVATLTLGLAAA